MKIKKLVKEIVWIIAVIFAYPFMLIFAYLWKRKFRIDLKRVYGKDGLFNKIK